MRNLTRYISIGSAVAVIAGTLAIIGTLSHDADAADAALLSSNRPITASSVEIDSLGPTNAVDGNSGTRWASAEGSDPQWIAVDLGSPSTITRVRLTWEKAYGRAYQIQTSNDQTTWRSIYTTTSGNGGTDNLTGLSGTGRYVRVYGTARGTRWGYSLWDMRVYGRAGASANPTGSTPSGSPSATPPAQVTPTATATSTTTPKPTATSSGTGRTDLTDPRLKDIAMQLVSSAENSSLNWKAQYSYIEDIGDGRGYTAGIIGFCSGTGDMLEVVERYTSLSPNNVLSGYLPALRKVDGSSSHSGLDPNFPRDWRTAAADPLFQQAQDAERDAVYFSPAVSQAKQDGLRALGQFIYYDAIVMHGPGSDPVSFGGIRKTAMSRAKTPAQGGDEVTYLNAFLDARKAAMLTEAAHDDTSRVDTAQRVFLSKGNLDLTPPLSWKMYGESFSIER